MIEYDFEQSLGYIVCTTAKAIETALNDELRAHGITFRQWQVLACVALLGEPAQGDIASRLGIDDATLVGVLDRMERDGWIRRLACPTDRRKKIVQATAQVEPTWKTMAECARRVRARAVEGLSPAEQAELWRILGRVQANLATDAGVLPRGANDRGERG